MHIVGDEHERAFVGLECVDQRVDGEDVEVGRRLVHEEEVGRIDEEFHEVEPGFLSAGKDAAFFLHIRAAEKEGAEDGAGVFLAEGGAGSHDLVESFGVRSLFCAFC